MLTKLKKRSNFNTVIDKVLFYHEGHKGYHEGTQSKIMY